MPLLLTPRARESLSHQELPQASSVRARKGVSAFRSMKFLNVKRLWLLRICMTLKLIPVPVLSVLNDQFL